MEGVHLEIDKGEVVVYPECARLCCPMLLRDQLVGNFNLVKYEEEDLHKLENHNQMVKKLRHSLVAEYDVIDPEEELEDLTLHPQ